MTVQKIVHPRKKASTEARYNIIKLKAVFYEKHSNTEEYALELVNKKYSSTVSFQVLPIKYLKNAP